MIPDQAHKSDRRQHLVTVAMRLFRDRGFHATGIDAILAESGVAKRTLYLHFRSKDELIVAVLAQRDEAWRDWLRGAIKARTSDPRERLLAIFDALEEWFVRPDFHGCMFTNAAAEFPKVSSTIHREAARHKDLVREFVRDLAEAAKVENAEAVTDALCVLMEGAIVLAQIHGTPAAARQARAAAAELLGKSGPNSKRARLNRAGRLKGAAHGQKEPLVD
jgi:AcrR family transcriptional regulator